MCISGLKIYAYQNIRSHKGQGGTVRAINIKTMELTLDIRPSGWLMSTACGPCQTYVGTSGWQTIHFYLMKTYVLMF